MEANSISDKSKLPSSNLSENDKNIKNGKKNIIIIIFVIFLIVLCTLAVWYYYNNLSLLPGKKLINNKKDCVNNVNQLPIEEFSSMIDEQQSRLGLSAPYNSKIPPYFYRGKPMAMMARYLLCQAKVENNEIEFKKAKEYVEKNINFFGEGGYIWLDDIKNTQPEKNSVLIMAYQDWVQYCPDVLPTLCYDIAGEEIKNQIPNCLGETDCDQLCRVLDEAENNPVERDKWLNMILNFGKRHTDCSSSSPFFQYEEGEVDFNRLNIGRVAVTYRYLGKEKPMEICHKFISEDEKKACFLKVQDWLIWFDFWENVYKNNCDVFLDYAKSVYCELDLDLKK